MFGKKKNKEELDIVEATDTAVEENIEEPKAEEPAEEKPKKQNPFKNTGFVLKIFAAAVLLALGLWMIFDKDTAEKLIVTLSGAAILILCVARLIYIFRAKDLTKKYKFIVFTEVILEFICGVFLIGAGYYYQKNDDSQKKFVDFVRKNYRWFVGAVLYLRGVVHFYETGFLKAKTSYSNYFVNIILITLGTFCFAYKFTLKDLRWVIVVLVLLSFTYLAQDGIRQYISFKSGNSNGEKRKNKKKEKEEIKNEEIPASILDEPKNDQPMVN